MAAAAAANLGVLIIFVSPKVADSLGAFGAGDLDADPMIS